MKVSYNWLKELVDLNGISQEKFLKDLSLYCIEIDGVEAISSAKGLVVGKVLEKEKHPNADKLSVCQVDVGTDVRQIVCGAPNCEAGKKVIVALPGATLPGGKINVSKIRGVESFGMLCSLHELGIENKYIPVEYSQGIYFLDDDAVLGEDAIVALGYDDIAIELGLTPNRMDLLSMLGVAQDVSAMYNRPLIPLKYEFKEEEKLAEKELSLDLQTRACYSYYARIIKDVTIKESPQFIKTRLMSAGIRPINNVVDITNYVLLLFGQPLHAFDQDKLGGKIIVRRALDNEKLVTLDEQERLLKAKDIVITDNLDQNGRIVALGGVMGGLETEVLPTTKNVVLESAVFRGGTIRRTSKRLNLHSESSVRYERGVDLNRSKMAIDYACYLLQKYADGKILKGYLHDGIDNIPPREYEIEQSQINKYLGIKLTVDQTLNIFKNLGFSASIENQTLKVAVPNRRMDITLNADLIEEVARMYGYEHLNETLPAMSVMGALTKEQKIRRLITNQLAKSGCNQVITYSLNNPIQNDYFKLLLPKNAQTILISNPLTEEHSALRMNLVSSLLDNVKYNSARKNKDNKVYEISKCYYKMGDDYLEEYHVAGAFTGVFERNIHNNTVQKADFFLVKGILEQLFIKLDLPVEYRLLETDCKELHPTRTAEILLNNQVIGYIGEVHPQFASKNNLDETYVFEVALNQIFNYEKKVKVFKQIYKIPPIERDLALVMDINQPVSEIIKAIYSCDKETITNVLIFDEYVGEKLGEGLKSIAVRITIETPNTLTEDEITSKINKVLKSLEYRYHVSLRS